MITKNSRIYVAGHKGLVGSSVLKVLREKGFKDCFVIALKNGERFDINEARKITGQ